MDLVSFIAPTPCQVICCEEIIWNQAIVDRQAYRNDEGQADNILA